LTKTAKNGKSRGAKTFMGGKVDRSKKKNGGKKLWEGRNRIRPPQNRKKTSGRGTKRTRKTNEHSKGLLFVQHSNGQGVCWEPPNRGGLGGGESGVRHCGGRGLTRWFPRSGRPRETVWSGMGPRGTCAKTKVAGGKKKNKQ